MTLLNCTMSGNTASSNGGALFHQAGTVDMRNTIAWGNGPNEIHRSGPGTLTADYCDIEQTAGVYAGTGNINADPMLADTAAGDYGLSPGSPCIDAGDAASPRDPDGTRADMGAVFFDHSKGPIAGRIPTIVQVRTFWWPKG